jgi:phosphonate transport system substrate-binding protein
MFALFHASRRVIWGIARTTLWCAVLSAVVVGGTLAVMSLLDRRGPTVDLSEAAGPAAHSSPPSVGTRGFASLPVASAGPVDRIPGVRQLANAQPPRLGGKALRFAVATMVSAESTFSTYRQLVRRICRDVGREEAFVLRPSYAEVRQALENGQVDVALVCTGTYSRSVAGRRVKLLVEPELEDGRVYQSLILVPAESPARSIEDLAGAVMAFTDPESNTGYFVPSVMLREQGHEASTFLRKTMFTGSHDRSIRAVALRIVDAAAVDSLVWESAKEEDPALAKQVRVVWASEPFGPPPVVVPADLDETLQSSLRKAFLGLAEDKEGRGILSRIGIRRFVDARPEDYDSALRLYERFAALEGGAQESSP